MRSAKRIAGRIAGTAAAAAAVVGAVWLGRRTTADRPEAGPPAPVARVETVDGRPTVRLDETAQRLAGLKVVRARSATWRPVRAVFGRVAADPALSAEVRAPFAGTVRVPSGREWPRPTDALATGAEFGRLEVRLGRPERLSVAAQLRALAVQEREVESRTAEAEGKVAEAEARIREAEAQRQGAAAGVELHRNVAERLRKAAATVTRQEIDDAEIRLSDAGARMAESEARLAGARQSLRDARAVAAVWKGALSGLRDAARSVESAEPWEVPLVAPPVPGGGGWEVVESAAKPGESIEAGAVVLRLASFRTLHLRMDFPPDTEFPATLSATLGSVGGGDGVRVEARLLGPAPAYDAVSQSRTAIYAFDPPRSSAPVRPGLFARAEVPAGPEVSGVKVPESAVLQHERATVVYVEAAPGAFVRRAVVLDHRDEDWAWLRSGIDPSDRVVTRGAAVLLSEEFKGRAGDDDD